MEAANICLPVSGCTTENEAHEVFRQPSPQWYMENVYWYTVGCERGGEGWGVCVCVHCGIRPFEKHVSSF